MPKQYDTEDWIFQGFANPNTTAVPDDFFDFVAPRLKEGELRVCLYMIRRTYGFKKESDDISISQMMNGITTRDNRVLDLGTGLSKQAVITAVKSLEAHRVIIKTANQSAEKGNMAASYRLNRLDLTISAPLSTKLTRGGGQQNGQALVNEVDPQETVKQQTEIADSNIRRSNRSNDVVVDNSASHPISFAGRQGPSRNGADADRGVEGIAAIIAHVATQFESARPVRRLRGRQHALPNLSPEIYEAVVGVMQDYTRKLGDGEHLASNITQASNLIAASGCDFNTFYMHVIDAYKITCQRKGLDNRSRYFFTVLRDSLLPSDTVGT
ncbi:MAG: replication protein, partial [Thermomicrobiales bacterium]